MSLFFFSLKNQKSQLSTFKRLAELKKQKVFAIGETNITTLFSDSFALCRYLIHENMTFSDVFVTVVNFGNVPATILLSELQPFQTNTKKLAIVVAVSSQNNKNYVNQFIELIQNKIYLDANCGLTFHLIY